MIVTGTDTGVGKTIVSAALCAITGATYVKAAQTGSDDDAAEVARLAGVPTHVLARFSDPLAPASAGKGITAAEVVAQLGSDPLRVATHTRGLSLPRTGETIGGGTVPPPVGGRGVVLEGAGGLLVRLGADRSTLADVAALLDEPVLVVARAGLGTLNHTALTCEALGSRGLTCAGIVIGAWPDDPGLAERRNLDDLPRYAGVPLLGRVPEGAGRLDPVEFRAQAPTWIKGLP